MIFASNNKGKIKELQEILSNYKINSLEDSGLFIEVEENQDTFEKNAIKKAKEIFKLTNAPVIADDSGLCVSELDNWPGVYSDRFLGEEATVEEKNLCIINRANETLTREAFINCTLAYYDGKDLIVVSESLKGKIALLKRGSNGFGFDEVFELPCGRTLAELTTEEKNKISARKKAAVLLNEKLLSIGK